MFTFLVSFFLIRPATSRLHIVELLTLMWVLSTARIKRLGCFAPMSQTRFFCL